MQGAAGQFVAWGLDHFKGKTDPTGAVRALGSYRLAQATLRRLQVRMIDILVNDHDAIDEVVDRDLREMLKSADKDLKHLFGKRAALEPETVMREVDDWKARRAELEEHELKIPASKTTTTSLKKDKSLFSLELGILHAFIANPKLTDANGRPARGQLSLRYALVKSLLTPHASSAIHATRTNRAGGASKLEEEEYFQPPTLPALTDLSTRSRSEGSVPSPPAQEGSSAHLRPADGSSQAVASERTSRLSITPIPPSSMTPRKRRRSTRATASRHDSEDEDEQRMGDVTITPASTPRNKGKGRARVDATTSTTYSFVIDSLVPFKREDSSPLLDADFPSTRIDPIRIKKTTTTIAAATSHPIVTIGSRESSRLSSVSSLESGVSDQIEQDLVLTSSASGSSGSSSAVPLAQATFGPLSSSLRGSTTTKAAPVKKSPPTATTTRPRKKRKSGTPWDKAKPKKKLKKGGRKAMAADANVTKVEEGAEETDEGEESLPEDFEEGQNDVYVVGSIEERRKRRGVWEFKVRWVRLRLCLAGSSSTSFGD